MIVFASILGAILATSMLALNPSTITSAGAQMYGDQYGYDRNYYQDDNRYDKINFDRNLVNIYVNVNDNKQIRVTEPETGSLTVNKQVFGCNNIDTEVGRMNCQTLQDDDSGWLPCTDPIAFTDPRFCTNLPANLFDIEVLDDQSTQLQQFEGSAQGTTIQNLQPGTYIVNEIKNLNSNINQLEANPLAQGLCVSQGFAGGGTLTNTNSNPDTDYTICFEYVDEADNDCSTLTLAAGENKLCTVKNYISVGALDID